MTNYLLDTNHASRLMSQDSHIVKKLKETNKDGATFSISITVLSELFFAVYASQHQQQNKKRLIHMLQALPIYEFDQVAAEEFGKIQAEQKAKGRPIPPMDAQIAAVARKQALTILTADKHFSFIDGLNVENWLT
ncbi:MAG: PIN domain-containing protein [Aquificales bacterium]|nr:PIN domain-containing protein [Aquificales bacterium]